FLVDTLDHLLRIPIPDSLMRLFLYVLRECGVKGVPSFEGFRKIQAQLRERCGVPTMPCKSPRGNVFWMVDPRAVLAKDWSSPEVRPHLHVYPEIPDGPISEVWHTEKWHSGLDLSMLSPMYDAGDRHYYVNELAQLRDGQLVIPMRWVVSHGELYADMHYVSLDPSGVASYDPQKTSLVPAHRLAANYFDLEAEQKIPKWTDASPPPTMPNPLRDIAEGEPLYSSFVNHFVDDVSGNRSKSWNKHINTYITHANLPRKLLQQEAHIHFVSTSPHATAAEQFLDFKRVVVSTHSKPVRVVDAMTNRPARFRVFVHAEPSDNPMQSEISSHIGGNGNLLCRKCEAGGTTVEKTTDEGFHSLFTPGKGRQKANVLDTLKEQVKLACLGVESKVRAKQTETGVKDPFTEHTIGELIQRAREEKKASPHRTREEIQQELLVWVDAHPDVVYSPFLTMPGLDPTKDTPIEILHTILLGVVKYAWHWTHTSWNTSQKAMYALRLQATNTDGLSIHAIRANYIIQYANSLIGRQLKTVAQTTAFHVQDILPPLQFKLWLAIGELTALIWFPEINDMKTYKADLTVAIANVLDIFADIDPSKIIEKVKLHVLSHGIEDVSRFGPLIGMCTEGFESFNGVFRNASIHSNHIAPSRDIAQQLADHEAHKHRLMGGKWQGPNGDWVHAGTRVRDFLRNHPTWQHLFGWSCTPPPTPGSFKLVAIPVGQRARPSIRLSATNAHHALNVSEYSLTSTWTPCRNVVSGAADICIKGSWVCARSPINVGAFPSTQVIGRIDALLADSDSNNAAIIILDLFEVASTRHPHLNMPWLVRRQDEPSYAIVKITDIHFSFNVQHDCFAAGCAATGERNTRQERVESSVREKFIEHQLNVHRYIINLHSLHNPHLIRSILPRELVAPVPHFSDRHSEHCRLAQVLRDAQCKKQIAAAARKAAKEPAKAGPAAATTQATEGGTNPDGPTGVVSSDSPSPDKDQQDDEGSNRQQSESVSRPGKRRRVEVDEARTGAI
ncbi:hypothetical protein C2E23DRAFT_743786, partial [Lenzites betulinus]